MIETDKLTGERLPDRVISATPASNQEEAFERALRPYAEYQKQLEANAAAATTQKKTQDDATRRRTHQDREDIHSAAGGDITDPEEEGWAKAAKEYYEGK